MLQPTDPAFLVRELYQRITDLERQVAVMAGTRGVYVERARVVSFAGGTQCNIDYTPGGPQRVVTFLSSYTPVALDQVLVINSPVWSGVLGKVSA